MIAVIHGKQPTTENIRLDLREIEFDPPKPLGIGCINSDVKKQIRRWVRGFHAALYEKFLPIDPEIKVFLPFPSAKRRPDGQFEMCSISHLQPMIVEAIKRNRIARRTDRITCNNGKMTYECVWSHAPGPMPVCAFALDIYDWQKLGDDTDFPKRGCVGCYSIAEKPISATFDTKLAFPLTNRHPLDPFRD